VVLLLLELCHGQQEQIQALRDELAQLNGPKLQPVIKPSALDGERTGKEKGRRPKFRGKRDKTAKLEIHESVKRQPAVGVPQNSRFKGYQDLVAQDIRTGYASLDQALKRMRRNQADQNRLGLFSPPPSLQAPPLRLTNSSRRQTKRIHERPGFLRSYSLPIAQVA